MLGRSARVVASKHFLPARSSSKTEHFPDLSTMSWSFAAPDAEGRRDVVSLVQDVAPAVSAPPSHYDPLAELAASFVHPSAPESLPPAAATVTLPPLPLYSHRQHFVATTPAPAPPASAAETTSLLVAPFRQELTQSEKKMSTLVAHRWATYQYLRKCWVWPCVCGARVVAQSPWVKRGPIIAAVNEHVRDCDEGRQLASSADQLAGWVMTMRDKFPGQRNSYSHVCHANACLKRVDTEHLCQQTYASYGWATFFCPAHTARLSGCVNCNRKLNKAGALHDVPWRDITLSICDFCINLCTTQAQLATCRESPGKLPEAKRTKK